MKTREIRIVEYHQEYGTYDEIKNIVYQNFLYQQNSSNLKGVYKSMKWKYGNLVYIFFLLPFLLLFTCYYLILNKLFQFDDSSAIIVALIFAVKSVHLLGQVFLLKQISKVCLDYVKNMLKDFNITEKYTKEGGAFWLAVWYNPNNDKSPEIIGHFGIIPEPDYWDDKSGKALKAMHLHLFGVCRHARRVGVGKMLLEQAIKYAQLKKADCITLGVLQANISGINLYKKYGFKIVRPYQIDSLTGSSLHIMVKILD